MVFLRVSTDKVSILQSQNDPVTQSIKTGPASKLDNTHAAGVWYNCGIICVHWCVAINKLLTRHICKATKWYYFCEARRLIGF